MKSSILLVTADGAVEKQLCDVLADYPLYRCSRGQDAAALCLVNGIDLLMVSSRLPDTRGSQLFADLQEKKPQLAGLLIADTVDNRLLSEALENGFSGILGMPIEEGVLRQRVGRALEVARLRRENTRLQTLLPLYSLGEQFISSLTREEVLESLLDVVEEQTGAANVSVMLYNEEERCLQIAAARGMDRELARSIRVQPGDQISGWVFARRKPVLLNRETQAESIFAPLLRRPEIASAISFPMIVRGQIVGVLNVSQSSDQRRFSEADIEMLSVISTQAAMALENLRFIREIEEKARLRTLFEQYVSPEVAELLLASRDNLTSLGRVREVTILFADIRNFTNLVQHLELEDLRAFLNAFFKLFTDTIYQCRGTVDKFMGDAVLAIFGAPVELANASQTAVEAALAIREGFEELRKKWACRCQDFCSVVDLGIAITAGEVFLGNVGSARRLDYTVIGTNVNIAQRLAAESFACQIYITGPVKQELSGDLPVTSLGAMQLRGVEEPVEVFSVDAPPVP